MQLILDNKCFGVTTVLGELTLSVANGEFVALTGPSGVGKTTLLRILAGLDTDWQGTLDWQGMTNVGMMFQEPRLMPWLTALENVALVSQDRDVAQDTLAKVGLADAASLYPNQLSGGMQRRVAMARALINAPDLLVMDEPFASLDKSSAAACQSILVDQCRALGSAVLFVTHDLSEALSMADRVLVLGGKPAILKADTPVDPGGSNTDEQATLLRELQRIVDTLA